MESLQYSFVALALAYSLQKLNELFLSSTQSLLYYL